VWSEFTFLPAIRQWDTLKSNLSEDRLEKGLSRKTSSGRLLVVLPSLGCRYRSGTETQPLETDTSTEWAGKQERGLDESDVCREQNPLV